MALDESSGQLHLELRQAVQDSLASRRPLLHHLNADTSWCLQLPRPESAIRNGARFYYNILIDPWLQGGQSDLASWFSQQWHATASAVGSIAALEELLAEMEILASDLTRKSRKNKGTIVEEGGGGETTFLDCISISHEFTDHCHQASCLEIHPDVPVFAIKEAATLIQSWGHFRTVVAVDIFGNNGDTDWRSSSTPPLPDWIGISRLLQKNDVLNYHSALMICFNNRYGIAQAKLAKADGNKIHQRRLRNMIEPGEDEESAEAIVYTPHGIHSGDLALIPRARPAILPLAFLHGLHNVRVGTASGRTALQSNLGAHNGLKAQRLLNAKYWIGTHDEVKIGGGLVAWFLQRDVLTLKDAIEEEQKLKGQTYGKLDGEFSELLDSFEGTNWVHIDNGESRVLL